ncbi:MAG: hypothetical protein AB8B45_04630, partial [Prochlorococcus sp.]
FTLSIYMPQRIGPYSKNTLTPTNLLTCHEKQINASPSQINQVFVSPAFLRLQSTTQAHKNAPK